MKREIISSTDDSPQTIQRCLNGVRFIYTGDSLDKNDPESNRVLFGAKWYYGKGDDLSKYQQFGLISRFDSQISVESRLSTERLWAQRIERFEWLLRLVVRIPIRRPSEWLTDLILPPPR